MKKLTLLLLLISGLVFADAVIFSGSDVKTLKPNIDLFGTAKILTTASDPSSGGGLVAPIGSIALYTTTGELYSKTGAGNTAWVKKIGTASKLSDLSSTTSAELAGVISDETGTNKLVYSDSPSLVTPSLGAATATSINSTTIPSSKTLVVTTDKLSALSSTTSSELAGVVSDETGTNKLVYSDSPSLVTPSLGAATATSINSTTIPSSKTLVVTTDKISTLSATTSSELAGVISDETGTAGNLVFSTSPSLTTPSLGVASATSINKVALTAPATGSTLTIADGKTLTANNSITLSGTDSTTMTFPSTSATIARTDNSNTFTNAQTFNTAIAETSGGTGQSTYATGDLLYASAANTLSKLPIGSSTKVLRSNGANVSWSEPSRENLLLNPYIEDQVGTEWTTGAVGTVTRTTTSGEFTEGLSALKISLSAQAMRVGQSVATLAGSKTQYVIGASYKVPSTLETFQICTAVNHVEKTCVPSANLVLDNTYRSIEIPEVITPGQSVGITFKTSSDTGDAFVDDIYIKQGLGTQNLALDRDFTAKVAADGTVSGENVDWLSTTDAGPTDTSLFTLTFNTGIFTQAPNCIVSQPDVTSSAGWFNANQTTTVTSTTLIVRTSAGDGTTNYTNNAKPFTIHCQKSGNDYLAASSAVYSQASANTDWVSLTYTQVNALSGNQGLGSFTAGSVQYKREGGDLLYKGKLTTGIVTGSEARIPLPNSLTSAGVSIIPTIQKAGEYSRGVGLAGYMTILIEPSVGYFVMGQQDSTRSGLTKQAGTTLFGNNEEFSFNARIPISGWSNAATIVGSFAGVPSTGEAGNVDTFSVSYAGANPGTTSATVCTAGNCALDYIGNKVSSISWGSTGNYTLNLSKTYTKLKCMGTGYGTGGDVFIRIKSCASCASVAFATPRYNLVADDNSYGTITCTGSY